jgi:hypothetical protein
MLLAIGLPIEEESSSTISKEWRYLCCTQMAYYSTDLVAPWIYENHYSSVILSDPNEYQANCYK